MAWWGASLGAMLAYVGGVLLSFPPTLLFFPRPGSWGFVALTGEPAIRWYGWLIDIALGALAGFVVGRFLPRRPPWALLWWIAAASWLALAWHERQWFLR